jgi:hypothetical protein
MYIHAQPAGEGEVNTDYPDPKKLISVFISDNELPEGYVVPFTGNKVDGATQLPEGIAWLGMFTLDYKGKIDGFIKHKGTIPYTFDQIMWIGNYITKHNSEPSPLLDFLLDTNKREMPLKDTAIIFSNRLSIKISEAKIDVGTLVIHKLSETYGDTFVIGIGKGGAIPE